jgi:hypothetical protein
MGMVEGCLADVIAHHCIECQLSGMMWAKQKAQREREREIGLVTAGCDHSVTGYIVARLSFFGGQFEDKEGEEAESQVYTYMRNDNGNYCKKKNSN